MRYIKDVYAKTKRGGKMSDADKAKVLMGGLLTVNIGMTVLGAQFIMALGIPFIVIILLQSVLYFFICIQIFRFLVFREQDRDMEESDLFLPYYKLRSGTFKIKNYYTEYERFELKNGSFFCAVTFKFGMNDSKRAEYTERFLDKVQDLIHERNLLCRFIVMNENFSDSEEASVMLDQANSVKEPQLRMTQLSIYNEVIRFVERNGAAPCIYLMIYAQSDFHKDTLEDVMAQVCALYDTEKSLTAFRKMENLDEFKVLSLFKQFYGLAAIDLSLSRVQYHNVHTDILKSITVYRIITEDQKIYSNKIFDKISTGVKFINK